MVEKIGSLKKTARFAGLLYLVLALLGYYALIYVPRKLIVRGNIAVTTHNLIDNEFLYRTGIASQLISVTVFLFFAFVLYKLLKGVNAQRAKLMVGLVLVQVPIVFLLETMAITALMVAKGQTSASTPIEDWRNVAVLFLKIHSYGITVLEIFWGLWLIPFGQLVYKSIFIPRLLGTLLIMAGIGYTLDSFTFLLFPEYRGISQTAAFIFSGLGEGSTILWLLIIGVKDHLSITVLSETEAKPINKLAAHP